MHHELHTSYKKDHQHTRVSQTEEHHHHTSVRHEYQEIEEFYEKLDDTIKKTPRKTSLSFKGTSMPKLAQMPSKIGLEQWATLVWAKTRTGDFDYWSLPAAKSSPSPTLSTRTNCLEELPGLCSMGKLKTRSITLPCDASNINRVRTRTYAGSDIGRDYDLVLLTMKIRWKKKYQAVQPLIKFNIEKLKDPAIEDVFRAQLGERFAALNFLDKDINDLTTNFNEAIRDTAEEVLGLQRKKHQPWISNDILNLCDKTRSLKKTKNSAPEEAA
jgi:hypothetical protein